MAADELIVHGPRWARVATDVVAVAGVLSFGLAFWWGAVVVALFALVLLAIATELTATLLLAPIGTRTLATQFWSESSSLSYGAAAPYALLLVVPNFENLKVWAKQAGLETTDMAALVKEPAVRAKYDEEVTARTASFARYERPKKVIVLPREFSIEAGEITPKLSIKRKVVEEHYAEQIEAAYAEPAPPDQSLPRAATPCLPAPSTPTSPACACTPWPMATTTASPTAPRR